MKNNQRTIKEQSKNNQIFNTLYMIMSGGCSKCEASAGHGVIQYQTGGSKCEIRGCSKCENRLLHESCFSQLCSKCVSVTIYI